MLIEFSDQSVCKNCPIWIRFLNLKQKDDGKTVINHFCYRSAMRAEGKWLLYPKHLPLQITNGLVWPSMHGQGEWDVFSTETNLRSWSSSMLWTLVLFYSYVLECASCGIIYRSRQYWMGNQDPESSVVRPEVKHVWQDVSHISVFPSTCWLHWCSQWLILFLCL